MEIYLILGFIFVSTAGTLFHFIYDWFKHNKFISIFVAVNESTWEHLKLALLPIFIWSVMGIFLPINNLALGTFVNLLSIIILIPVIFYTYTTLTKKPILIIDILSFYIAIACGTFSSWLIFSTPSLPNYINIISVIGCCIIALCFILFTPFPPKIFLFRDPLTNKYGRSGHLDDNAFN